MVSLAMAVNTAGRRGTVPQNQGGPPHFQFCGHLQMTDFINFIFNFFKQFDVLFNSLFKSSKNSLSDHTL